MYSPLQTLVSYLLPPSLYLLRYSPLLLCTVSSLASFILGGGYPYGFVGLGVFFEFVDKVVKVLLFLLPIFQRSLLEVGVVLLCDISTCSVSIVICRRPALNNSSSVGDTQ